MCKASHNPTAAFLVILPSSIFAGNTQVLGMDFMGKGNETEKKRGKRLCERGKGRRVSFFSVYSGVFEAVRQQVRARWVTSLSPDRPTLSILSPASR